MKDAPPPRLAKAVNVVGEPLERLLLGGLPPADLLQQRGALLQQHCHGLLGCALAVGRGLVIQPEGFQLTLLCRGLGAPLRAHFGKAGEVIDKARDRRSLLGDAFVEVSERLLQAGEVLGVTASRRLKGFRLGSKPAHLAPRRLQRGRLAQRHLPRLAGIGQQARLLVADLGYDALEPIHSLAQGLQPGLRSAQLIALVAKLGLERAGGRGKGFQGASLCCLKFTKSLGESELEIVAELLSPGWRPREFGAELIQHFAGRLVYGDAGSVDHESSI